MFLKNNFLWYPYTTSISNFSLEANSICFYFSSPLVWINNIKSTPLHPHHPRISRSLKDKQTCGSSYQSLHVTYSIYFIKKEFIYTKLKYSRVPQYDVVSGGVAALFSGFLGFLVAEKFGFELLDSGDFYFLFMYIVFISLTIRLIFKIISNSVLSYWWYSPKIFSLYILDLITLLRFRCNL